MTRVDEARRLEMRRADPALPDASDLGRAWSGGLRVGSVLAEHDFRGVHIISELYGVGAAQLDDLTRLRQVLEVGAQRAGATVCGVLSKRFEPHGLSLVLLLSESHVSVHTYPEHGALFFDAFTCGSRCRPELILEEVVASVAPSRTKTQRIERE